ncbi:prepilin-type N-terminal cleavage/methylation domain-containing protein [Clostridium sp. CS001]|uniref:prepilin-type N-terminal cleavage/methylation domain-containing protein n=1 Tax=Clostridium sp. CS001 TaxID=2880648 RepID=UPI0021F3FA96|nr:prepilin-type N-terminal cleavage/methylation domain-containing protein [Clostridium sp. CS001]
MKKINKKKGFTLIELIIVIAVIGIIAAITVPKFGNIQKDAKIKADIATAKVIADATTILIGKDEIKDSYSAAKPLESDILGYLQTVPTGKAIKDGVFLVKIDANTGNVEVNIKNPAEGTAENPIVYKLYPTQSGIYAPPTPTPTQ